MVCLVFLGLCAGAMLNGIGAASRQASIAEEKLLALAVAKSEMEKTKVLAKADNLSNSTTNTYPTDTGIKYPVQVRRVVASASGFSSKLKSVTITVSWTSTNGPEHSGSVVLQTYMNLGQ